jgi:microcystin-dependent protein
VLSIDNTDYVKISNKEAWIKIASGSNIFAKEKLMVVPYSIHAQNGLPTGSIMPYIGTTAPAGWLLCDGSNIPTGDYYAALRKVLGDGTTDATKLPNLNGLFLRGTGTSTVNSVSVGGNTLKAIQDQQVGSHTHTQTGSFTSATDWHDHKYWTWKGGGITRGTGDGQVDPARGAIKADPEYTAGGSDDYGLTTLYYSHNHTVTLSGNTSANSGTDTRPANYGVTYIIKI